VKMSGLKELIGRFMSGPSGHRYGVDLYHRGCAIILGQVW
jgi:hypothetical protein